MTGYDESSSVPDAPEDEALSCDEPELIPFQGALQTPEGAVEFDTVEVSVNYSALDANEPCVTSVAFWFRKSNDFSCELFITAEKYLDEADALVVSSVTFDGEGGCPGFPPSLAATYYDLDAEVLGSISLGAVQIQDDGVFTRACHESSITVRLAGTLDTIFAPGGVLEEFSIDGTEFVIEGPLRVWDEPASCPVPRE